VLTVTIRHGPVDDPDGGRRIGQAALINLHPVVGRADEYLYIAVLYEEDTGREDVALLRHRGSQGFWSLLAQAAAAAADPTGHELISGYAATLCVTCLYPEPDSRPRPGADTEMEDSMNASDDPRPPHLRGPRALGHRFRRPLTEDEFEQITAAAKTGGLNRAVRATWDILLRYAEGVSYDEAVERGLKFYPREYAIPQTQHDRLNEIWTQHRGSASAADVAFAFFSGGPASYPDREPS
jgi:hypothetical protein